uniref:Uncharacterized protein n=1 Tax=Anguilla anguilla TaxID=7936 RepID=A0A0E9WSA2_ANGAN
MKFLMILNVFLRCRNQMLMWCYIIKQGFIKLIYIFFVRGKNNLNRIKKRDV